MSVCRRVGAVAHVRHRLVGLLRRSVYSRLAGYEGTNDTERLAQDPTMRIIVGRRDTERPAASASAMSRFETEVLTQDGKVDGLGPAERLEIISKLSALMLNCPSTGSGRTCFPLSLLSAELVGVYSEIVS